MSMTIHEACEIAERLRSQYKGQDLRLVKDALHVLIDAVIKSERRAITFGDLVSMQTSAMRAAIVDAKLRGPDAGLRWIANTLSGPGHLPDVEAAKAEGGAQAMFDREVRELEEFRSAHPLPEPPQ